MSKTGAIGRQAWFIWQRWCNQPSHLVFTLFLHSLTGIDNEQNRYAHFGADSKDTVTNFFRTGTAGANGEFTVTNFFWTGYFGADGEDIVTNYFEQVLIFVFCRGVIYYLIINSFSFGRLGNWLLSWC